MMLNDRTKLVKILAKEYPNPESELNFSNDFELVVSVILSAQSLDRKVNQITPALFQKYPTFSELSKARVSSVEKLINQINYYKTKAKNIVAMAKMVVEEFHGVLPTTHEEMIRLPGVGRKTANVVLGEKGIIETFPVDTHVFRLSRRLGFSKGKTTDDVEDDVKKLFKSSDWRNLHHYLIFHGRRVCFARNPACDKCKISKLCPKIGVKK